MSLPALPLLLLLALLFCFDSGDSAGTESELQILLDLRTSLGINNDTSGFESWSSNSTPCSFYGISCDPATHNVNAIDLTGKGLLGTIPFKSLCRLPFLADLSLGSNNLSGNLTPDIRNCTQLRRLDLAFNKLEGGVPDLSPLSKLQLLNLSDNHFSGLFPWTSLVSLTELQYLSLGDNSFDRSPFPDVVVNLPKLCQIYLSDCNLDGKIPPAIGNLTNLFDLELSDNFLTGVIPPDITKLNKLYQLELYNNSLTGTIPLGFRNLSELAFFDASMNGLEGDLSELRFLTKLVSLQLFFNNFSGEVPPEFGDFKYLVNLSLYSNSLTGVLPAKLGSWSEFNFIDVSTNFFTGPIPPDMCRMGTMLKLLILENNFTGEIPASYANCPSLLRLRVSNNQLSGVVPAGLWGLPNVNIIDLAVNRFEGPVTADIGKAKSLYQLYIADNQFSGDLPSEISGASALVSIDASNNRFSGQIPSSIGGLTHLVNLVLDSNSFSGAIPDSLGSCVSLNAMNLSANAFSGVIPMHLGKLPVLNSLDLSNNQLSGEIPTSLSSLKLSALDLSNNRLTGAVPAGLSIDAFNDSFVGNPGLCADDSHFLRRCASAPGGSSDKLRVVVTAFLAGFAFLLASLGVLVMLRRRRQCEDRRAGKDPSWDLKSFRILTFDEQEIINSIKEENLIGKGGSGNVYRVSLGSGKVVAVKHIWTAAEETEDAGRRDRSGTAAMLATRRSGSTRSKEFEAEVGTLSAIRHVNVVKLYCAITSEDASLLVYEHLPNGSLWERLHGGEGEKLGGLEWGTRVEVAAGAARGLEYLHHGCDRPILHRDVKSSNILLDEVFKPRIADFGLAKILHAGAARGDSTHVIAGTHGYIAPEYAYTWKVNEKSDVYSFGVVLMELVTGRRPIEPDYGENKDIVHWVSSQMTTRESVLGLIDRRIPECFRDDAVRMLKIAVLCTARLPAMRPSMKTVVQMLEELIIRFDSDGKDQKKVEVVCKVEANESYQKTKRSP